MDTEEKERFEKKGGLRRKRCLNPTMIKGRLAIMVRFPELPIGFPSGREQSGINYVF